MRKFIILSMACLTALCAMAQTEEINAVKFVQGQTTDWYLLSTNPEVTFTDHNPVIAGKTYDLTDGVVETAFGTAPAEKITLTASDFTVTKDGDWTYDQTEKRVKVEFNPELIAPSKDNIDIYYNNDKMVKPIDPGTYQVYIDIRETDTYAAVTGITSDAWKFDIIDPKGAIQAIEDKKEEAVQAINSEAGDFETVPTVQKVVEGAKVDFGDVTITATNTINEATDQSTITTTKDDAISKIDEIEASAKTDIQTAIANFKESVITVTINAATDTKSKIDAFAVSDQVKYDAISEIDKAVAVAKETIDNANSQEQVNKAKQDALNEISKQLENVEASYAQLQAAKESAIQKIEEVAADAEAAIDEAAGEYASLQAIWEIISSKKEEIASRKGEASHFIGDATDMEEISQQKEEAIQHIENIKSKAVEEIQAAIQEFIALQEDAINEVEQAAATAKEEIDGLGVDESAKSEAKAEIDNIVNTAKQTINAATSKDAIDKAKTEAIAKIHDVVQTTKNMWVTVRTDGAAGNWNTICLERNITAIDGATFWTISGQDATSFILDEVTEPQAGQGYLIRFTADELKVKYGDQVAAEPVTATYGNPIQGTYTQIDATETNVLVGNYVVYNNQLCPVESWVGLHDHRAYIVTELVPNDVPQQVPSRARAYMPKPKETPTELESVDGSQCTMHNGKFFHKGQLVIVKDNKIFNALGFYE